MTDQQSSGRMGDAEYLENNILEELMASLELSKNQTAYRAKLMQLRHDIYSGDTQTVVDKFLILREQFSGGWMHKMEVEFDGIEILSYNGTHPVISRCEKGMCLQWLSETTDEAYTTPASPDIKSAVRAWNSFVMRGVDV